MMTRLILVVEGNFKEIVKAEKRKHGVISHISKSMVRWFAYQFAEVEHHVLS